MASRLQRSFRLLLVGALAIPALAVSPALAGKKTAAAYVCLVTPNPVVNASPYTVAGSGFPSGMVVNLYIKDKVSTWIVYGGNAPGGTVAADGTFSIGNINSAVYYPYDLGQKTVSVVNANDKRTRVLCKCTFSVQ
jgi:hypothetical protein